MAVTFPERFMGEEGTDLVENCQEPSLVGEFLCQQIEQLFKGKRQEPVLIASFRISREGLPFCVRAKQIKIRRELAQIAEHEWIHVAGEVLLDLGYNFSDVSMKFTRELDKYGWTGEKVEEGVRIKTREKIFPIQEKELEGKFSQLIEDGEFEMVVCSRHRIPLDEARKTKRETKIWQILVRRVKPE